MKAARTAALQNLAEHLSPLTCGSVLECGCLLPFVDAFLAVSMQSKVLLLNCIITAKCQALNTFSLPLPIPFFGAQFGRR
jgi:hypothetical protein